MTEQIDQRARRKFLFERGVGRYVANPTVRALRRLGIDTALATELETIGRKSGALRLVPIAAAFDESGAIGTRRSVPLLRPIVSNSVASAVSIPRRRSARTVGLAT